MVEKGFENLKFGGCSLSYHADNPAFSKNPSTIKSETPRPVTINGNRMTIIDMHAHCQLSNVWRTSVVGEAPISSEE